MFTFVDLFSGIGGFHQAAKSLGGKCVFACDIDKFTRESYYANYDMKPKEDIRNISSSDIPDHDVLFAGFPCQPFSIIGLQKGFKDSRGNLFFEIERIIRDKKPNIFILENVKQLSTHNHGKTFSTILEHLKDLGYSVFWKIVNALDYGLPQKRERVIIVGFKEKIDNFNFPNPHLKSNLNDILEDEVDPKYYASKEICKKRHQQHTSKYYPGIWHENKSGNITSYPYSCALRAGASYNYSLVNGERRLTPREMLRLQGFPDSFKIVCSDTQTRKQAGNAVPVNVIKIILEEVLNCANQD